MPFIPINVSSADSLEGSAYSVTDMTGRLVLAGNLTASQQMSLLDLNSGVYVVTIGTSAYKIVRQ